MQVLVYDPFVTPAQIEKAGFKSVGFEELLRSSDYITIHVPKLKNTDGFILDEDGDIFARIYIYDLEKYLIKTLFSDLTEMIYPDETKGVIKSDEFKNLSSGKMGYFALLTMNYEKNPYPVLFLYQKGEDEEESKSGTIIMVFFETGKFLTEEAITKSSLWVEGIGGSLIQSYCGDSQVDNGIKTEKTQEPSSISLNDRLTDKIAEVLLGYELFDEIPSNWKEFYGDIFSMYLPPEFSFEQIIDSGYEVVDLISSGIYVGKVFAGETDGKILSSDLIQNIYSDYLTGLGSFKKFSEYSLSDLPLSLKSFNIVKLDFPGFWSWIILVSESTEAESFGPGEFIIFVGISPKAEETKYADYYFKILGSIDF